MRDIYVAITAASYSGNKGAAAMLQSSIRQLYNKYGHRLNINLMSVYPSADLKQVPWDFVKVIPSKPEQIIFIAFPLAVLYWLFKWCVPVKWLLLHNKVLKAYSQTDVVLDEAGVSFVDSRGFVMNTYAFITVSIPLLMGVPVIKYSQAMGSFKQITNRVLAKIVLPKLSLICARGEITRKNLEEIGITRNVKLCADGAFTMKDDPEWIKRVDEECIRDAFYESKNIIGVSPSSVVNKKCNKDHIDYVQIMADFIGELTREGYMVLIIANSARENSQKTRNNDLMICDEIYNRCDNKDSVRWYHKEMDAEEIRAYIGKCRFVVASRFHAMVGALELKIPVLLIGWSHKYQEVLDFFQLGKYATDYSSLSTASLMDGFHQLVVSENEVRNKLDKNYDSVINSSYKNIEYASEVIDNILAKPYKKQLLDYKDPDKYMGPHIMSRKGYSTDEKIRDNAASGGTITAFLCYLLKTDKIDGAWVSKAVIVDGKVTYRTFIATSEEEIRSASSSIYMYIPMMDYLDMVKKFDGRVAVVMVPCMLRALKAHMKSDPELQSKIVLKIGLFCSGNHSSKVTELSLEKAGVTLDNAERFYYRRGHWRGVSSVVYKDGSEKTFSYSKILCAYKNAYFFEQGGCMFCQDHFANASDISFGDIWLKEMKKNSIKHSSVVIRSEKAMNWYKETLACGVITDLHISDSDMVRSQKRALVFKFPCAKAKVDMLASQGKIIHLDTSDKCKWNHRLVFRLAKQNRKYSKDNFESLRKVPMNIVYYYMCFMRVLLNF